MTRAARLLDLLQALRRHRRPVTAAALADETGVSLRTLYRDIAALVAQGAPIVGEAGLGYVLSAGYLLPPLSFTADEVDALILGLRLAARRGDEEIARGAADALAKIEAVLPAPLQDAAATSGLLAAARKAESPAHLGVIRLAIRTEQRLRLRYADKTMAVTERVVWPIAIGFFEAAEVLAAWCESRRDFRHFRLDRIQAAASEGVRMPKRHRMLLAEWRLSQNLDTPF